LNVAKDSWMRDLEKLCRKHDMLLIVDDIQAGCGRSGHFFSFESSGVKPDMVTMSKSLSGFGLPMALLLLAPELDVWSPGEHNGTFRGNNHAFVTAATALEKFWSDDKLETEVRHKADIVTKAFKAISDRHGNTKLRLKGKGLMQGLSCPSGEIASQVCEKAFEQNLVVETAGNHGQVVKCLCPLTISEENLRDALDRLAKSFDAVLNTPVSVAS
jgi:diaminobutyrate-2-oxoglutarate transaminase